MMRPELKVLPNDQAFDVVVVGAGMVGASAAIGLAALGLKILVVEAFANPAFVADYSPSYDARSTALSWGARDILFQLGVWGDIQLQACPIRSVHVSEQGRFGVTRMEASEFDQEALGYVVPNQWLGQCLLSRLSADAVPFCAPAKITRIVPSEDFYTLHLNHDEPALKQVTTRLLVIADGTCSETAALMGIDYETERYGQHALIANVSTELPNLGLAFERFTKTGPIAMLPLTESTSSLVWTHNDADIQTYLGMNDAAFCQRLQHEFGDRLGQIVRCGKRGAYPLRLIRAKEQYRPGVLLLGNAAHSLHPVAGQGFNLALRGVAAFLEAIDDANSNRVQRQHTSIGSTEMLRRFCLARKRDQENSILFSDQLVKIFGSDSQLIGLARDAGLIGLNNMPAIKSLLARGAMGLAGRKAQFGGRRG